MIEKRKAPGGRRARTWLLSAASGIALAAFVAAGVPADAQEVVVGPGQTSSQIELRGGETLIVEQGGTVRDAADAVFNGDPGSTVTVINRGTIISTGEDAYDGGNSSLHLTNSGLIWGQERGVTVENLFSFVNSGTVWADDTGVRADFVRSFVNTGMISGEERGVFAGFLISLVNTGTISGTNRAIFTEGSVDSIVNTGKIVSDGDAIYAEGPVFSLENSGTIRGGTNTNAAGISMSGGAVINAGSGLIEGRTGIEFFRAAADNASVTNAGRIRSTSGPAGIAIDYDDSDDGADSLTVLGRSTIEGFILWDGDDDTFATGPGRSSALTLTDSDSDAGDPPTEFTIDTGGLPFAVERTAAGAAGTATTKVVVIDPSSFGVSDTILADITGGISGVLTNQGDAARDVNGAGVAVASANGTSMTIAPAGGVGPVLRAWAEVFGGWRGEESDGSQLGSDHVFGGAVAGIETDTAMDGMRAGFFIGGSGSKVDVEFGSQDTEIGSVFGGVYAAHQAGDVAIDAALTVGLSNYDQRRFMNDNTVAGGVDTARADYYGFFVSPEVTVSSSLAVTEEIAVRPSLTLRYAGLFLDGYTEKGSNANLAVENRDVHVISARGQVAVPVHMNTDAYGTLTTEIRVGADGRATVSEDNVRATLLGQNLNFTAGGDDEVLTGFAGAAFAYAMTTGTRLYGNIETGYGTDEAAHVTGRAGVKMPF